MASPFEIEALLAALGPERILRGTARMHKYQIKQAADLPQEIRRRLLRFLATDDYEEAAEQAPFDYQSVLDLVSSPQDPDATQRFLAAVPDRELGTELGIGANRIRTWANGVIPRESTPTVMGQQPEEPDPQSTAAFRRTWEVANDPMVVLRDLAEGCLSDDQVATLSLLYPETYREIRQAMVDALAATKGRRGPKWEPPPGKAEQIGTLTQSETVDPQIAAAVQQVYAQDAQRKPPPPPRRSSSPDAAQGLTPGQKATAG